MTFIWPIMLIFLVLVPIFVASYLWLQQRRRDLLARYGALGLTDQGSPGQRPSLVVRRSSAITGFRRHLPAIIFLVALTILIVALARPQTVLSLPRVEGTVILDFDVSGSMAATDLQPTRLDAAKAAASDFVQNQPSSVQIGVVTFSDGALPAQVPTNDQGQVLLAISRLTTQKGTSVGEGIQTALKTIDAATNPPLSLSTRGQNATPTPSPTPVPKGTYSSAVIILLTDGENNESPDPLAAAQAAADRGVRIYTVGIGSPQGADLKVNGFTIHTRLDEQTLQLIAQMTGGDYYNAQSTQDLKNIYDKLDPQIIVRQQNTEVTSLLAGAGILLLLVGGALSLLWLGRVP
jgi:Ca-activated chloride channel family protein